MWLFFLSRFCSRFRLVAQTDKWKLFGWKVTFVWVVLCWTIDNGQWTFYCPRNVFNVPAHLVLFRKCSLVKSSHLLRINPCIWFIWTSVLTNINLGLKPVNSDCKLAISGNKLSSYGAFKSCSKDLLWVRTWMLPQSRNNNWYIFFKRLVSDSPPPPPFRIKLSRLHVKTTILNNYNRIYIYIYIYIWFKHSFPMRTLWQHYNN